MPVYYSCILNTYLPFSQASTKKKAVAHSVSSTAGPEAPRHLRNDEHSQKNVFPKDWKVTPSHFFDS